MCADEIRFQHAGLVGFVINGAVLPRSAGNADTPLRVLDAVPFVSPPSLQVEFVLPNRYECVMADMRDIARVLAFILVHTVLSFAPDPKH